MTHITSKEIYQLAMNLNRRVQNTFEDDSDTGHDPVDALNTGLLEFFKEIGITIVT